MPRRRPAEPRWVPRLVVDAVHLDQLRAHGGLAGLRDEATLEAALARPRHKWAIEGESDVAQLAAAYAYALVTSHPYHDGNKRVAFLTMVVFLGLNGFAFEAPEPEVVTMMLAAAANRASESDLASWIRGRMAPRPSAP